MYSIGVDIGTSTTEVILSNIHISISPGASLLPVTTIESVEVIYRSPVFFTPMISDNLIDLVRIREIIEIAFIESCIQKEEIESGAVIITGESARKENASRVSETLSSYLGDFIVATAGPKLESVLAGHGAGISDLSRKRNIRIINLDIGGGTLNASVFESGSLLASFAMDIGGRLVKFNSDHTVTYLSKRILFLIEKEQIPLKCGQKATFQALENLAECLADFSLQACGLKEMSESAVKLLITDYQPPENPDYISVSGGVGEYVGLTDYSDIYKKAMEYGDIGPLLGWKLNLAFQSFPDKLLIPAEKINATVIGAGTHSMTVSGSTVGFDEDILPLRNIPIIKSTVPFSEWSAFCSLTRPLAEFYPNDTLAVSIQGTASPCYQDLKILAGEIARFYEQIPGPVIILMKEDFAKALYQMIRIHTSYQKSMICLDHIFVENGDYIDIGTPVGSALPVVIKTLIYQS